MLWTVAKVTKEDFLHFARQHTPQQTHQVMLLQALCHPEKKMFHKQLHIVSIKMEKGQVK